MAKTRTEQLRELQDNVNYMNGMLREASKSMRALTAERDASLEGWAATTDELRTLHTERDALYNALEALLCLVTGVSPNPARAGMEPTKEEYTRATERAILALESHDAPLDDDPTHALDGMRPLSAKPDAKLPLACPRCGMAAGHTDTTKHGHDVYVCPEHGAITWPENAHAGDASGEG